MTVKYFWEGKGFTLYVVKHKGQVALAIKRGKPKGEPEILARFTKKEFSSFICEMVKYLLALPEIAREIPFYESCSCDRIPHGVTGTSKIHKGKGGYFVKVNPKISKLWERYHGVKRSSKIVEWVDEKGRLFYAPLKSKAKIIHDVRATKKR